MDVNFEALRADDENIYEYLVNRAYLPVALMFNTTKQKQDADLTLSVFQLIEGVVVQCLSETETAPNVRHAEQGEFYEVTEIDGESGVELRNIFTGEKCKYCDVGMDGCFAILMRPTDVCGYVPAETWSKEDLAAAKKAMAEREEFEQSAERNRKVGKTVWVLPKGAAPTCYVPRVVIEEQRNGMLLTVTPAIYHRLHKSLNNGTPLPDGISVYVYKESDVLTHRPNDNK